MAFRRQVCRSIREEKAMVTGATSSGDAKKATLIESEGRMSLGKDFLYA